MPMTVLTMIDIQGCVCVLGLIDESYSTGGIITAGVEQLRSRLFAMSHRDLFAHTHMREQAHA